MDDRNALHSFAHATGKYHLMGCILSAASCNKWWVEDILNSHDYAAEQSNITAFGENEVYFLPYLMGERSPHNDPAARGTFVGMTMNTKREDMLQAVLEGVAFALRDSYEIARSQGIDISRTKICGGGAKSPLWRKIIANVLGISVDTIECEEGPALGAAMLAACGCGTFKDVNEAASKIVKITGTEAPEPELVEKYEKKYRVFKQLYPALKDVYKLL